MFISWYHIWQRYTVHFFCLHLNDEATPLGDMLDHPPQVTTHNHVSHEKREAKAPYPTAITRSSHLSQAKLVFDATYCFAAQRPTSQPKHSETEIIKNKSKKENQVQFFGSGSLLSRVLASAKAIN